MNTVQKSGKCLCGEIKIVAKSVDQNVHVCHCTMCRKWGGGPSMSVSCGSDVSFSERKSIRVFSSSEWAERGFCSCCGSHIFYRLKENDEYILPVGIFDSDEGFVFDQQIFIDEKPDYYSFANKTKNLTGAMLYAQIESQQK
jgi:hypothetical protein